MKRKGKLLQVRIIGDKTLRQIAKPVEKITELAVNRFVVTLEEGSVCGGFGQYVASVLPDKQVSILGIPDKFVSHGSTADILNSLGLDSMGIAKSVEEKFRLRSNIEIN